MEPPCIAYNRFWVWWCCTIKYFTLLIIGLLLSTTHSPDRAPDAEEFEKKIESVLRGPQVHVEISPARDMGKEYKYARLRVAVSDWETDTAMLSTAVILLKDIRINRDSSSLAGLGEALFSVSMDEQALRQAAASGGAVQDVKIYTDNIVASSALDVGMSMPVPFSVTGSPAVDDQTLLIIKAQKVDVMGMAFKNFLKRQAEARVNPLLDISDFDIEYHVVEKYEESVGREFLAEIKSIQTEPGRLWMDGVFLAE